MESVLVVDDSPGVRLALEVLLSGDFTVYQAGDGVQALNLLRFVGVSAILLDLCMPGMGGEEILSRIRRQGCFAPVILMSVSWASGWDCSSKDEVFGRISKPWNADVVKAMVHLAVAHGQSRCYGYGNWGAGPGRRLSQSICLARDLS